MVVKENPDRTKMLIDPIAIKIWLIYESCNMIGREHLHPWKTKNLQNHFLCFLNLHLYAKNQVEFINSYLK